MWFASSKLKLDDAWIADEMHVCIGPQCGVELNEVKWQKSTSIAHNGRKQVVCECDI